MSLEEVVEILSKIEYDLGVLTALFMLAHDISTEDHGIICEAIKNAKVNFETDKFREQMKKD